MIGILDDAIAPEKFILVIDGEQDIRDVAQVSLQVTRSWSVITATSGVEGIVMAKQYQPEAILLDLCLDDIDGLVVLEALKADRATVHIPVLLMTDYDKSMLNQKTMNALKVSAKGLIQKPFVPTALASQIETALDW